MPAESADEKQPARRKYNRPRRNQIKKGIVGISAFIHAYRDEQRTNRKQDASEDRVSRYIEIATLIFVILTTAGIFYQACILNSSDEAIHKSANAAKDAADAAKASVEATNTVMKIDQRAWIGLDYLDPVPVSGLEVGKTFAAKAGITNTGKTPARNLVIYSIIEPVDAGKRPNFSYSGIPPITGGFLPPNGKASLPPNALIDLRQPQQPLAIVDQERLDLFKNKKFGIYAHGRIEYDDIFGDSHWMTYCSYLPYPSIGTFAFCSEHNETDDYKEPKK
jgi:hypothetical protein